MTSPLVLGPILPGDWPTSPTDPSYAGYTAAIRRAALDLVASVSASASDGGDVFERGKVFNESHGCKTETYSAPSSRVKAGGDTQGYKWHVRASRHRDVAYDDFKRGLLENHSVNERDYIEDCEKAEKLQVIKPGEMEIWRMLYHQAFPASNRSFTFLIYTAELSPEDTATAGGTANSERSFLVVSIPVAHPDAPPEKGYVRGRYVSVEFCRELATSGAVDRCVEWIMAVSSDPGGMVPKMVSDRVMASKISEDVPSFLKWIESRPAAAQTATTAATASSRDGDNPPTLPQIERSEGL